MGISSAVDSTTPAVLVRLGDDHARIAAVITQLSHANDCLSIPDESRYWSDMLVLMEFQLYFADRIHHPLEDRIFDRVLHKGLTPTEHHLVFKNLSQHQEIMDMTLRLMADVQLATRGGVVDRSQFAEQVAEYVDLQRKHMRFEELHLFPLVEARFDNKDWNELHDSLDNTDLAVKPKGK